MLYKLTKTSQIQTWDVEVSGPCYRTVEGILGGKLTTSHWTKCEGKNVGRSNETTPERQAQLEAASKRKKKLESGYVENLADAEAASKVTGTNGCDVKCMLAHKFADHGQKLLAGGAHSQPKLDGIRGLGTKNGMFSRNGKPLDMPALHAEVLQLLALLPEASSLDGELYTHSLRDNFNDTISAVRAGDGDIEYHVYDVVMPGSFKDRHEALSKVVEYLKPSKIVLVPTAEVRDSSHLDELYAAYLQDGYEGQMVRASHSEYEGNRSKSLLKRKEFEDAEAEILEVTEGRGNRSGMAGSLRLRLQDGTVFDSGIRGGVEFYRRLLADAASLVGSTVTVRYQNLTPDGVPRFPVTVAVRDYE